MSNTNTDERLDEFPRHHDFEKEMNTDERGTMNQKPRKNETKKFVTLTHPTQKSLLWVHQQFSPSSQSWIVHISFAKDAITPTDQQKWVAFDRLRGFDCSERRSVRCVKTDR
jgi:hypothetical protein